MDERVERIRAALARHGATLQEVKPLHGGACQENFRVELTVDGAPLRLALRSDAIRSLPSSIKRRAEFAVINAAVKVGVNGKDVVELIVWSFASVWASSEGSFPRAASSSGLRTIRRPIASP